MSSLQKPEYALSFDSFPRDANSDIVCVTPVRTVVRREEEIVLIRKVRKVEEFDASPACPVNTTQFVGEIYEGGELMVHANYYVSPDQAPADLPRITNDKGKAIQVTVKSEGTWTYGSNEAGIREAVTGDGNRKMAQQEYQDQDMLFKGITPAAVVATKIKGNQYEYVTHGANQTFILQPGETIYFMNNDQPGFYHDNHDSLKLNWTYTYVG
ncbi:MAG: hypothetical protein AAFO04_11510 [Cyanobacteria bacterium J06592_8]